MINIKSRLQEPKVYAVLFREDKTDKLFLSIHLAYSLEEVYNQVTIQHSPHEQWLPFMWQSFTFDELFKLSYQTIDIEVDGVKSETPKDKDDLMKKIIINKDLKLFKDNKEMFTVNEQKYIRDNIKKDGN